MPPVTARAAWNASNNDLVGYQPLSAEVATKSLCVLRASVYQYSAVGKHRGTEFTELFGLQSLSPRVFCPLAKTFA